MDPPQRHPAGHILPLLPDDLALECLLRVRLWDLPAARCVSRCWRAAICDSSFGRARRALAGERRRGTAESRGICLLSDGRGVRSAPVAAVEEWLCVCGSSKKWPGRLQWYAYSPAELPGDARGQEPCRCVSGSSQGPLRGAAGNERLLCPQRCSCDKENLPGVSNFAGKGKQTVQWRVLPPLPAGNDHGSIRCNGFSAAAVPGLGIAVAGGCGPSGVPIRHVSFFDWHAGIWLEIHHPLLVPRCDPLLVAAGGHLFLSGGSAPPTQPPAGHLPPVPHPPQGRAVLLRQADASGAPAPWSFMAEAAGAPAPPAATAAAILEATHPPPLPLHPPCPGPSAGPASSSSAPPLSDLPLRERPPDTGATGLHAGGPDALLQHSAAPQAAPTPLADAPPASPEATTSVICLRRLFSPPTPGGASPASPRAASACCPTCSRSAPHPPPSSSSRPTWSSAASSPSSSAPFVRIASHPSAPLRWAEAVRVGPSVFARPRCHCLFGRVGLEGAGAVVRLEQASGEWSDASAAPEAAWMAQHGGFLAAIPQLSTLAQAPSPAPPFPPPPTLVSVGSGLSLSLWDPLLCRWQEAASAACPFGLVVRKLLVAGRRLLALAYAVDRGRNEMRELGLGLGAGAGAGGQAEGRVGPGVELPGECYVAQAVVVAPQGDAWGEEA